MKYNIMGIMQGMKQETDNTDPATHAPADEGIQKEETIPMQEPINIASILQGAPNQLKEISITLLDDNQNNHFSRMKGQQWEEFVGSIREYGILTPLIVRPAGERYEIIAGHNRKYGALEAGLASVPCTVANVNDVDASVMIGITNNQREHVTDWEKGWAYRTTLEAIRHQGARTDVAETAEGMEESTGESNAERSVDIVARKYGVNRKTIQRKIRLTFLQQELYEYGLEQKCPQRVLLELTHLTDTAQINLLDALKENDLKLTEELAERIRQAGDGHDLTKEEIASLCRQEKTEKLKQTKPKAYRLPDELFPARIAAKKRQEYTEAALRFLLREGIDPLMIDDGNENEENEGGGA